MIGDIGYAWKTRRAWWFTATARTRERFSRTRIGSLWLGLSNLLSIGVLALVYGQVLRVESFRTYVVYLGLGVVTWNCLSSAVMSGTSLFKNNAIKIQNSTVKPIFYVFEEWGFQVQSFFQSFGLVVLILSCINPSIILGLITVGWIALVNVLLAMLWLPLVTALLGARYEDFYQSVPIVLMLLFLVSPIIYGKESLAEMPWIADINPLYQLVAGVRDSMLSGVLDQSLFLGLAIVNIFGLMLSMVALKKVERNLPFWI